MLLISKKNEKYIKIKNVISLYIKAGELIAAISVSTKNEVISYN